MTARIIVIVKENIIFTIITIKFYIELSKMMPGLILHYTDVWMIEIFENFIFME